MLDLFFFAFNSTISSHSADSFLIFASQLTASVTSFSCTSSWWCNLISSCLCRRRNERMCNSFMAFYYRFDILMQRRQQHHNVVLLFSTLSFVPVDQLRMNSRSSASLIEFQRLWVSINSQFVIAVPTFSFIAKGMKFINKRKMFFGLITGHHIHSMFSFLFHSRSQLKWLLNYSCEQKKNATWTIRINRKREIHERANGKILKFFCSLNFFRDSLDRNGAAHSTLMQINVDAILEHKKFRKRHKRHVINKLRRWKLDVSVARLRFCVEQLDKSL